MGGIINNAGSNSGILQDYLRAPVGTKMVFNQTAAPIGWTKGSTTDVALRLTNGNVGTGGSVAFETAFASQTPTISMSNGAVTLSIAQMPAHTHINGFSGVAGGARVDPGTTWQILTEQTGGGGSHTHTNSATSSAINLDVSYVDVIIATKD